MFRPTLAPCFSSARVLMERRTQAESSACRNTLWQWPREHCSEADSSMPSMQRPWLNVAAPNGSPAFSILSYNVLSDKLLQKNLGLYHASLSPYLKWSFRKDQLLSEIISYDSDILCLQEVEEEHFRDFFYPSLRRVGYEGLFMSRTGDYTDGCATFYRTSRFELIADRFVKYKTPGIPILDRDNIGVLALLRLKHPAFHGERHELASSSLSDPRNKSLASFAPRTAVELPDDEKRSGLVCVANTHLLFNPKRGDVKLAQLAVLLAEVDRMSILPGRDRSFRCPVVMCGDFNSTPWSPLYHFLRGGKINYGYINRCAMSGQDEGLHAHPVNFCLDHNFLPPGIREQCTFSAVHRQRQSWIEKHREAQPSPSLGALHHNLGLASSYTHIHAEGEQEFTTWHRYSCSTVDYIFFSTPVFQQCPSGIGTLERCGLRLLSRRTLLKRNALSPGMPNASVSSDHQAIQAMLEFQPNPPAH